MLLYIEVCYLFSIYGELGLTAPIEKIRSVFFISKKKWALQKDLSWYSPECETKAIASHSGMSHGYLDAIYFTAIYVRIVCIYAYLFHIWSFIDSMYHRPAL